LTERDSEMVCIVKSVQEIFVERMNVLKARETVENGSDLFAESFGSILDLADVESYTPSV